SVFAVVASGAWRLLRRLQPPVWTRRVLPTMAAALCVGAIGFVGLTALRFQPKPWNSPSFTDRLTGQIVRDSGATRGIVSMAGNGGGSQRVLIRADLLIAPQHLLSTSFQMEYLPSGALCTGHVTKV